MKSQATKGIALSASAAILALTVGFGTCYSPLDGVTTAHSSSIAAASRPPVLTPDVSFPKPLGEVIASGVGGGELLGHAKAGDPPCVTGSTNPCPPQRGEVANSPRAPRTQTICQPAGLFGQHCYRRFLP